MEVLVLVILLFSLSGVLNREHEKRLLLNDPSVFADRLTKLESTIQKQEALIQTINTEYQHQTGELQNLKAILNQHGTGTTYVRWARKQCPYNNTELVYSGYAGGGSYNDPGSAAEPVCLPPDPEFEKTSSSDWGRIYGGEFDSDFFRPGSNAEDVPCAVCRVPRASSVIMIPGKKNCYSGWTMEYYGYLASNYHGHAAAGSFVCIDMHPEFLIGGDNNDNGKLFHSVIAKCGSLKCPPYKNGYPLMCVVCSK